LPRNGLPKHDIEVKIEGRACDGNARKKKEAANEEK
jgi:hypothetical protein